MGKRPRRDTVMGTKGRQFHREALLTESGTPRMERVERGRELDRKQQHCQGRMEPRLGSKNQLCSEEVKNASTDCSFKKAKITGPSIYLPQLTAPEYSAIYDYYSETEKVVMSTVSTLPGLMLHFTGVSSIIPHNL